MSAKDAVATMGEILSDDAGGRDAVHVAVVSCVATAKLEPGQDIGIGEQQGRDYEALATAKHIGRVDPFLKEAVLKGQRFWLYLYPRSITGLNHQWTHPAFPDAGADQVYSPPSKKLASEKWMRDLAERVDISYNRLLTGAEEYVADKKNNGWGEYILGGSEMEGESVPAEFWDHYETVTGIKVAPEHRGSFFSCSC